MKTDKERLKELREFVISEISRPVGADDTELTAEGKDLLALIDSALAESSDASGKCKRCGGSGTIQEYDDRDQYCMASVWLDRDEWGDC